MDGVIGDLTKGNIKIDPSDIFSSSDELVKSNLNSMECIMLASSDALEAYYRGEPCLQVFKKQIRQYSRAKNNGSILSFVDVLKNRIPVEDRKQKIKIDTDDSM